MWKYKKKDEVTGKEESKRLEIFNLIGSEFQEEKREPLE